MKNNSYNHDRIAADILAILNRSVQLEARNENLKKASLTGIKLAHDYSVAVIYVDTYNREQIATLVNDLNQAKSFLRNKLAHKLSIRRVPKLEFVVDTTIDNSLKIEEILDKLK